MNISEVAIAETNVQLPEILSSAFGYLVQSLQSCPTLCDPMDSSPPGSSTHRILQARILEWVAISFVGVLHNFCYLFFFKSEEIYASDIFARSQTTVFLS